MAKRVVFLCTGNICRSPLAEVIAARKFESLGLSFCSAGLETTCGWPASGSSFDYAAAQGISLDDHRSQPVTGDLLADAAWVIGMTRGHAAIFGSRYRDLYDGAIGIVGAPGVDLARQTHSPEAEEVNDPYGMSSDHYLACGDQISRLLEGWTPVFAGMQRASTAGSGQETKS